MTRDHRRSSVAVLGLLGLLCVLVAIAATGIALVVFSDRFASRAAPWVSPLSAVRTGGIDPSLALGSLAGVDDGAIAERAAAAGSADTALATILYSVSLDDQARASALIGLARKLTQSDKSALALLAANTAIDVALLSPTMTEHGRVVALDQAGQLLASLGKGDDAARAYAEATTIAVNSGGLDPSYRQILLEALLVDVTRLGRSDLVRTVRAGIRFDAPAATSANRFPLLHESMTIDSLDGDALALAEEERIELAQALIASLDGQSPTPANIIRASLERALLAEDRLRQQVYADGLANSSDLLQRVAHARAAMQWQALKWRVARQGFGMALVPTWESHLREIEATLGKACDDYYLLAHDAAISAPAQTEAAHTAVYTIRDQIKMGRLGLPPSGQEAELVRALDKASRLLSDLEPGNLVVAVKTNGGRTQLTVVAKP